MLEVRGSASPMMEYQRCATSACRSLRAPSSRSFVLLGLATVVSTLVFRSLRPADGAAVSQHRAHQGGEGEQRAALANVQPPSQ